LNKNSLSFIQAIFEHESSYCLVSLLYVRNYLHLQTFNEMERTERTFLLISK